MVRTGGEIIVDYLVKAGVEYVIGIPGHGCLAFFDALRDRVEKGQINYIQVKQEMSGVHMADGYFRAAGKPLAVFTSIGAGALNTAIGLGTACADSTSVLVLTGDVHTHMRGVGVLQEIERKHDSDILSCFRPITKRCWRVENIYQLPKIMQRAFNYMLTGRKGPVLISMPMDVQAQSLDVELPEPETTKAGSRAYADKEYIRKAFKLMKTAKRPVIVAGGGLFYSRAYEELQKLAERWGAAVITTMAGKSAFPEDHPLYGWHGGSKGTDAGNYLCRTADVILSLGCRFADETTSSYRKGITYNFPDTKLIQVDLDAGEIGKNYPCDIGILGDVKAVINQLLEQFEADKYSVDFEKTEYFKDIQRVKKEWFKKLDKIRTSAVGELTISQFIKVLNGVFPKEGIIVTSSGNSQAQVLQEYCFKVPGTHITTGGFSTMGFGMTAALGVKLARPDVPVLALIGDGDFMMTMQEMSTAVQYNIPVITVVLNNFGWLAIKDLQMDVYGRRYAFGNDFTTPDGKPYSPDFAAIAENFGLFSQKVTKLEQAEDALRKAIQSKVPSFIEVIVNNKYPYSGGCATGWWDVPVPHYIDEQYKKYDTGRKEEYIG
ncbi:MAG: thiamine pyrophosphate-binding protein [Acetivibrionales bacterium]|jgi:acetolactate synthase-1/2/3 large subunit